MNLALCVLNRGPVYSRVIERASCDDEEIVWPLTAPWHPQLPVEVAVDRVLVRGLRAAEAKRLAIARLRSEPHSEGEYLVTWHIAINADA